MRRGDALAVGLANPRYTERYHPDREFGLRCLEHGLRGVFEPTLVAVHHHGRTLEAFRRDARSQGAGRRAIEALHGETIDAEGEAQLLAGLPAPLRHVVRSASRPRSYALTAGALSSTVKATNRVGLPGAQLAAARLLRRVEQVRGWKVGSA